MADVYVCIYYLVCRVELYVVIVIRLIEIIYLFGVGDLGTGIWILDVKSTTHKNRALILRPYS